MKTSISCAALLALTVAGATLFTDRAEANCGLQNSSEVPAVYRDGAFAGSLIRTENEDGEWEWGLPRPEIAGLWKFSFISEGSKGIPDGTVVDAGYQTWHSDGTELMNSGRAPITGDFCMGVWKQVGRNTYSLNHYALAFDSTGTTLVGPANIRETVTLNRDHDSFSGTFTLDQYSTDNKTVLAHVQGKITATRITVDCKGACAK